MGEFHQIVDVSMVVAMGPPGGGRNAVTPRAMRHFHYLAFPDLEHHSKASCVNSALLPRTPLNDALPFSCFSQVTIFGTISRWWLERTDGLVGELDRLVLATLDVYDVVLSELLPTPTKTHYTFNLRDLSKVFQGVLMAAPKSVVTLDQLLVLWYHENLRVYQVPLRGTEVPGPRRSAVRCGHVARNVNLVSVPGPLGGRQGPLLVRRAPKVRPAHAVRSGPRRPGHTVLRRRG